MISVVVNFFNNRREALNTLYSLTATYQRHGDDPDYEVIAIDNGSPAPLDAATVQAFGPQFRHLFVPTRSQSPVATLNAVCAQARGDELLILIDGAHILSPGILGLARRAFAQFPSPFIATVPFHLGPKRQNVSVAEGYDQRAEDLLLDRCGWRADGYRLFDIAGAYADGSLGWFGWLYESGCVGLTKRAFLDLGGFDEGFQSRGGGLANLDFFQRAVARQDLAYVMLLGEATFHQVHGGVASNAPREAHPWEEFHREYQGIRGVPFARTRRFPTFLGTLPPVKSALRIAQHSAQAGLAGWVNDPDLA